MPRIFYSALALSWLACAAWATPKVIVEAVSAPVRVSGPSQGMSLAPGSLAVLEWAPLAAFEDLHAQEWEAFLSLDGGAHYPLRITPHLDSDLRRVLWQVPATPTRNGRLLLRFGDERSETSFEVPAPFEIASPAGAFPVHLSVAASSLGEPAREGDGGVVMWVEGSRRGSSLRQVVALPSGITPASRPTELLQGELATLGDSDPDSNRSVRPAVSLRSPIRKSGEEKLTVLLAQRTSVPILLLIGRQNE